MIEVRPTSQGTCKESVLSSCFRASTAIASLCALASCGSSAPWGALGYPVPDVFPQQTTQEKIVMRALFKEPGNRLIGSPFSPLLGKVAAQFFPKMLKVVLLPQSWRGFDPKIPKKKNWKLVTSPPPNSFMIKTWGCHLER